MESGMQSDHNAAIFFNAFAEAFDSIYDRKRNVFMRWVDAKFRSDMFIRYALTFEALEPLRGRSVLDIGCGSGPYIAEAFRRGACRVTGIDPAPNMLALVRQRLHHNGLGGHRCVLLEGLFPQISVEPHDCAIVMGVMDYVADPPAFLAALKPVVKQLAVLSFPSRHWFRTPFRKVRYTIRRCPVYFYDPVQIRSICSAAGFSEIRIHKIPGAGQDYHVCLRP
jgi:2-polyprenyl-3-methyl-5-hydroxy-6-metoxy-1,4-benzoquinol methylase